MNNKMFIFFCTFLLLLSSFSSKIFSITVGSNTVVSVQGLTAFPAGANTMLGFAAFPSGITLAGATTLVIFDDYFPLGGPVTLNGGALSLNKNLTMFSNITLPNGGTIAMNNLSATLPNKTSSFSIPSSMFFSNGDILINSNVSLSGTLTFTGNVTVFGNGYTIDCTSGALACGTNNSSVLFQNVILKNASGNRLYCIDSTGTFSFNNATIILDASYTFTQGTLDVFNTLKITGTQVFSYKSTKTCTIHSNSTLYFDSGMTFSYDTNSNALLLFSDSSAILSLYETTLFANSSGLKLTKGTFYVNGLCPLISSAANAGQGIAVGDGASAANNVTLSILAESGFNIQSGFFVYNNV